MAKLRRELNGDYTLIDTGRNLGNLDLAAQRETPQDKANVDFATKNYGYSAGTGNGTTQSAGDLLPKTSSLVPAGVAQSNNESDIFNLLMRDALIKFQGINTADLEKKKRALQMTAIGEQSKITPDELRTFSPTQQESIRSGNINALQPEFDDVKYQLDKAQQATSNFENVFEKVSKISEDYAAKMVAPDSVIENYKKLIEANPENINTYLSKVNDKTRDAILQTLDYTKLKSNKDDELLTPSEANQLNVPYGTTRGEAAKQGIIPKSVSENTNSSGLTQADQNAVLGLRTKFESNANVTRYAKALEAKNFVADLSNKKDLTSSDAQGLVYAFAKAMDPDSVVREGEYATVQKYAQSWFQQFGFEANRILNGETFLSPQAVKAMKSTIDSKYKATKGIYDQYRNQTIELGKLLTGGKDVSLYFTDYENSGNDTAPVKDRQYYKNLYPQASDEEIDALLKKYSSFNNVGGDTNKAVSKAISIPDNSKGGQCGRFVNQYTGLGLGDTYSSKLSKMDKSIKQPKPGMVFVMPYKDTGHTGFILSVNNGIATVKDSNYSLDGKVQTHQIPVSKMTGFANV